ncbi:MAG TPA: YdcF family protein [Candidatus Omnitrophota bacterium]|nr:YdcF family protein [Candidatus Omnitrophota bacterium]
MTDTPGRRSLSAVFKVLGFGAGAAGGLFALWCAGFLWFVATVPDQVGDPATVTDAIVVLTGGSERLATGVQLLEDGRARKLFVSGVHKDVELADILKLGHADHGGLACCVVLGYSAPDTVGNAAETARWMAKERFRSLRLVTGAYHMPRSLLEFRRAMPDAAIVPHPVFPDAVKSREWWRWPGTAALLATEYSKYLAAVVRHWFLPSGPPQTLGSQASG